MVLLLFCISDRRRLRAMAVERAKRAFRPGTVANQESHALLYLAFTIHFRFTDLPADSGTLICFAEFLLRSLTAVKSVTNALSAVRRLHLDLGFPTDAFEACSLVRWKRALPLTVRSVPHQAPPLPLAMLERLCQAAVWVGGFGCTLRALLTVLFHSMARVSSLLPYSGARFDKTRHVMVGDCRRQGDGYLLQIKWGKTLQSTGQAFWVPLLPREGSPACPVVALRQLLEGEGGGPDQPLFRAGAAPLSVSLARSWLRVLLASLGLVGDAFTFHSFRRGSCTQAFARGAQLEDLQALGGWRSGSVALYRSADDARLRAARALNAPHLAALHSSTA